MDPKCDGITVHIYRSLRMCRPIARLIHTTFALQQSVGQHTYRPKIILFISLHAPGPSVALPWFLPNILLLPLEVRRSSLQSQHLRGATRPNPLQEETRHGLAALTPPSTNMETRLRPPYAPGIRSRPSTPLSKLLLAKLVASPRST